MLCSFSGNCIKWELTSYSNTIEIWYKYSKKYNTTSSTNMTQIQCVYCVHLLGTAAALSDENWQLVQQSFISQQIKSILTIEQIQFSRLSTYIHFSISQIHSSEEETEQIRFSQSRKFILWRSWQFRFKCNLMRFNIKANAVPSHPR